MKKQITPTLAKIKTQVRKLDIQWSDSLVLHDGSVVQAVEVFDDVVKVNGGHKPYVRRDEIKHVYPSNQKSLYAENNQRGR